MNEALWVFWYCACALLTYGVWLAEFGDSVPHYDISERRAMAFLLCLGGPMSMVAAYIATRFECGMELF